MGINIIVAYDKNRLMGDTAKDILPWQDELTGKSPYPEDMRHFKRRTMGHPVIMGRKTYDSIPPLFRPLVGRTNIIISRRPKIFTRDGEDVWYYADMVKAINDAINIFPLSPVFIIGGLQIYKMALDLGIVDTVIASELNGEYKGDIYFPPLSPDWMPVNVEPKNNFNVVTWRKNG